MIQSYTSVTAEVSVAAFCSTMSSHSVDLPVSNASKSKPQRTLSHQYPPNHLHSTHIFGASRDSFEAMMTASDRNQAHLPVTLASQLNKSGTQSSITLPPIINAANTITQDARLDACTNKLGLIDRPDSFTHRKVNVPRGHVQGHERYAVSPQSGASQNDGDIWISLNGRRVRAHDLIGLRVAKTFVGHGRFLGQVLKFTRASRLYTISYADGDQEELGIDDTVQILIQNEIELPDPEAVASLQDRICEFSITGPILHEGCSPATLSAKNVSQYPNQISEHDVQYIENLFRSEALPVLIREGWRFVQSDSGGNPQYIPPHGYSQQCGIDVFISSLDVVQCITRDPNLMHLCFPPSVHETIFSLVSALKHDSPGLYSQTGPCVGSMHSQSGARYLGPRSMHSLDHDGRGTSYPNYLQLPENHSSLSRVAPSDMRCASLDTRHDLIGASGSKDMTIRPHYCGIQEIQDLHTATQVTGRRYSYSSLPKGAGLEMSGSNLYNRRTPLRNFSMRDVDRHGATSKLYNSPSYSNNTSESLSQVRFAYPTSVSGPNFQPKA